jgi:hypothetical protein
MTSTPVTITLNVSTTGTVKLRVDGNESSTGTLTFTPSATKRHLVELVAELNIGQLADINTFTFKQAGQPSLKQTIHTYDDGKYWISSESALQGYYNLFKNQVIHVASN